MSLGGVAYALFFFFFFAVYNAASKFIASLSAISLRFSIIWRSLRPSHMALHLWSCSTFSSSSSISSNSILAPFSNETVPIKRLSAMVTVISKACSSKSSIASRAFVAHCQTCVLFVRHDWLFRYLLFDNFI